MAGNCGSVSKTMRVSMEVRAWACSWYWTNLDEDLVVVLGLGGEKSGVGPIGGMGTGDAVAVTLAGGQEGNAAPVGDKDGDEHEKVGGEDVPGLTIARFIVEVLLLEVRAAASAARPQPDPKPLGPAVAFARADADRFSTGGAWAPPSCSDQLGGRCP